MSSHSKGQSGGLLNWRAGLLLLSIAVNLILAALLLFPGATTAPPPAASAPKTKMRVSSIHSLASQRRKEKREEREARLAAQRIAVPIYVAQKASPGNLLKDGRVSDKLAQAFGMSDTERKRVNQLLADHEKALSDFIVAGSREEVDDEGKKWIVVPNPAARAKEQNNETLGRFIETLGQTRGSNCIELIKKYRPFRAPAEETRFSISNENGTEVVHIVSTQDGKVVSKERQIGTENITRDYGKVIERFKK